MVTESKNARLSSDFKSFFLSAPHHHRRHEASVLLPTNSPLLSFLSALDLWYYEQLAPETRHLHKPRLLVNRNPLLQPFTVALHQERQDAACLPSHLFCPHALRCLHSRYIKGLIHAPWHTGNRLLPPEATYNHNIHCAPFSDNIHNPRHWPNGNPPWLWQVK